MDDKIFGWGSNDYGELTFRRCNMQETPLLLPRRPWKVKCGVRERWEKVARWLFLGRGSKGSGFSWFPMEVLYHFAMVNRSW